MIGAGNILGGATVTIRSIRMITLYQLGAARFSLQKGTGFYHSSFQFIRKYLLQERNTAYACIIASFIGAAVSMIESAATGGTYSASAVAQSRCIIAYWATALVAVGEMTICVLFIRPLLQSNDVYGIRIDLAVTMATAGYVLIALLYMIGANDTVDSGYFQQIPQIIGGTTWPLTGAVWPVLQSYGIEPLSLFRKRRSQDNEPTEGNLLAILADPHRCAALREIAIRNFSTENIVFLEIYLNNIKASKTDEARRVASPAPSVDLPVEVQRRLYDQFVKANAEDELNLPSAITKPIHAAILRPEDQVPGGLWIPVYQEVVKMVLSNCMPHLKYSRHSMSVKNTKLPGTLKETAQISESASMNDQRSRGDSIARPEGVIHSSRVQDA